MDPCESSGFFFGQVIRTPLLISAKEMKINSIISRQNNLDLNHNLALDLCLLLVIILKQMICVNLENLLLIWNQMVEELCRWGRWPGNHISPIITNNLHSYCCQGTIPTSVVMWGDTLRSQIMISKLTVDALGSVAIATVIFILDVSSPWHFAW